MIMTVGIYHDILSHKIALVVANSPFPLFRSLVFLSLNFEFHKHWILPFESLQY